MAANIAKLPELLGRLSSLPNPPAPSGRLGPILRARMPFQQLKNYKELNNYKGMPGSDSVEMKLYHFTVIENLVLISWNGLKPDALGERIAGEIALKSPQSDAAKAASYFERAFSAACE